MPEFIANEYILNQYIKIMTEFSRWGEKMKFRNPKSGEVFDCVEAARVAFCHERMCNTCVLENAKGLELTCAMYANKNNYEAARLMGYEVILSDKAQKLYDDLVSGRLLRHTESPIKTQNIDVIHVRRKTDEVDVMVLSHKDGSGYSFVNLTKGHICPCVFKTVEDAIEDLINQENVVSFEVKTKGEFDEV